MLSIKRPHIKVFDTVFAVNEVQSRSLTQSNRQHSIGQQLILGMPLKKILAVAPGKLAEPLKIIFRNSFKTPFRWKHLFFSPTRSLLGRDVVIRTVKTKGALPAAERPAAKKRLRGDAGASSITTSVKNGETSWHPACSVERERQPSHAPPNSTRAYLPSNYTSWPTRRDILYYER